MKNYMNSIVYVAAQGTAIVSSFWNFGNARVNPKYDVTSSGSSF